MQEEVTQKTITLSIQAGKLTAAVLQKALKKLLVADKNKLQQPHKGKQTLRQLMKQNTGVSNIEITNDNIKAFEQTAKKYGIDFALKKDISTEPPRYMVFFKGRDADVLTAAFKEFSAKNLDHEKKPSLRKLLPQAREKVKQKTQQREKDIGAPGETEFRWGEDEQRSERVFRRKAETRDTKLVRTRDRGPEL